MRSTRAINPRFDGILALLHCFFMMQRGFGRPEMFFLLPKNIPGRRAEVSRRRDFFSYYAVGLQDGSTKTASWFVFGIFAQAYPRVCNVFRAEKFTGKSEYMQNFFLFSRVFLRFILPVYPFSRYDMQSAMHICLPGKSAPGTGANY